MSVSTALPRLSSNSCSDSTRADKAEVVVGDGEETFRPMPRRVGSSRSEFLVGMAWSADWMADRLGVCVRRGVVNAAGWWDEVSWVARRAIAREREVVFIFVVCFYALSLRLMPPIVSLVLSLST